MPGAALPARLTLQNATETLRELSAAAAAAAAADSVELRLDAGALRSFDSSAIAVLLELRRQLLASGKTLVVDNWPQRLQGLVALYGVGELLHP